MFTFMRKRVKIIGSNYVNKEDSSVSENEKKPENIKYEPSSSRHLAGSIAKPQTVAPHDTETKGVLPHGAETDTKAALRNKHKKRKIPSEKTKAKRSFLRCVPNWAIIVGVVVIYALIVLSVSIYMDDRHVKFYVYGELNPIIELGESFSDTCRAVSNGSVFPEGERELPYSLSGAVDVNTPGCYELVYSTRYFFRDYELTRTVTVIDNIPPVIELKTLEGYHPGWLSGYTEEGYTATDNFDGDISDKVKITEKNGVYTYTVSDSSGNSCSVERRPFDGIIKPEICLRGDSEITINACSYFEDPGCGAVDEFGNDISGLINVEGDFVPWRPGSYTLTYSISNDRGETIATSRVINVLSLNVDNTINPPSGTIYLTFDDGPGPYTEQLLDILDAYGAKATFFVTDQYPSYRWLLSEIYDRGHAIGLHSFHHDYYSIYASEEDFFWDMLQLDALVYDRTGIHTKLLRFPGGSSNTVSSFNPGIMTRLTIAVESMGYKYFDWNINSGDADQAKDKDEVAENIINGCAGRAYSIVLLHDTKGYSVEAVETILAWGAINGFSFRALNMTSPGSHHGVNN